MKSMRDRVIRTLPNGRVVVDAVLVHDDDWIPSWVRYAREQEVSGVRPSPSLFSTVFGVPWSLAASRLTRIQNMSRCVGE